MAPTKSDSVNPPGTPLRSDSVARTAGRDNAWGSSRLLRLCNEKGRYMLFVEEVEIWTSERLSEQFEQQ